ncbi:MAG TPA: CBS domain-containing protein [Rhodothermales bacterium]|nr:CBS domain-containing protein [Rhodothermales bacterium]
MIASQLLSPITPALKPDDTIEVALELLSEYRVRHLPVVQNQTVLLGIVSEEQLLSLSDWDETLEAQYLPPPIKVQETEHAYEVARLMSLHDLTTIPVEDKDGNYAGLVERKQLYDWFCTILNVQADGVVLELEAKESRDFSPARIAYLVEENNGKILSLTTDSPLDWEGRLRVTLKLNTSHASRIRHVLEHHGYQVLADFGEGETDEDLQYRAQAFLRYLEV